MNPTPPAGGLPVYDPRGVVTAAPRPIAPRAERLDGLRLAVLDNTKWNANRLLRKAAERLAAEHRLIAVRYYRKESFSRVANPALLAEIAEDNDLALTAIGD
jgi:hypothetical protein